MIECPKHNGRFNLVDGSPARAPICRGLATYPVEERSGGTLINVASAGEWRAHADELSASAWSAIAVSPRSSRSSSSSRLRFRRTFRFTPGDYLQFDIPAYEEIRFSDFDIPEPFSSVWKNQHIFDFVASNPEAVRRNNYSLASNPRTERLLRFNVRIATPPPGQDCPPGVGSSYMFNLKPGDKVSGIGPFGDFHIKPTQREMVYIGGGAGMAPLVLTSLTCSKPSDLPAGSAFGMALAQSRRSFTQDYFRSLADGNSNFQFQLALSTPLDEDQWTGHVGLIHQVVFDKYLQNHPKPASVEYYLCGPPMMIKACTRMLHSVGVSNQQIAYDEF